MKKTPHQVFIENLRKQMNSETDNANTCSKQPRKGTDASETKLDIAGELERKFDELFGSFDDDS